MKKKRLARKALAWTALAAALALLPCGASAAWEPDWDACERQDGMAKEQACRERVISWWERKLDAAVQVQAGSCPDASCRKRLQQAMDDWTSYRDSMAGAAIEAAGYKDGVSMEQAGAGMRYRLTKAQALSMESLSSGKLAR